MKIFKNIPLSLNVANFLLVPLTILCISSCELENVNPNPEPVDAEFKLSSKSVSLSISSVSASAEQSPNVAANVLDNNTGTRWSGYGNSVYFYVDLGSTATIDYLKIAFYKGNTRTNSFEVATRNSTSASWTKVGTKTSSGTTASFETFDVSNSDARYLRLKCKGNSVNLWNSITELEIWGTGDPDNGGGNPGTGGYPADVLGISANTWKINSFVGNPSSNPTYYDDITDAPGISYDTYSDDNYFYTDGEWVFFKCYRGLGGSSNSSNPRVELREMDGNGNTVYWTNEGTNTMTWTVRVDQLSNDANNSSGVTCVGQIHGPGSSVDDVIRVQFYGDAGQTSGNVRLKIGGYITEDVLGGSVFIDNGYKLDTEYTFKLEYNSDDYVTLYCGGSQIFSEKMDVDMDDNYFKVGNYVQSSKNASYDGSYCLVAIKDLSVVHN